jgi:hypothetical protein
LGAGSITESSKVADVCLRKSRIREAPGGSGSWEAGKRRSLDTRKFLPYGLLKKVAIPLQARRFSIWRCSMPFNIMTLSRVDMPVSQAEGLKILERDNYCCQYCGLDGKAGFENALVMSVDFVVPRAHKGKKNPGNLVACCRPCNMIKGTKVYKNFEEAKKYVLARREEMRQTCETKRSHPSSKAISA